MPEDEGAGADRPITVCAIDGALKPVEQRWMFFVVGSRPAWHQQQVITFVRLIDVQIGLDVDAV
ncbi:hypothetical protein D3C85_1746770 [compost metagenome]